MGFGIRGRLRPQFLVRDRAVLTGHVQRIPQRIGVTIADPVSGRPTELTVFKYPGPKNAPQLLAVHGFRGDHHGLELIVDGLTDFEVWVPDLPGFGLSPALPDAHHHARHYGEIITQVASQLRAPVLLGHSFGSVIAGAAVASAADNYAHLVLLNPITKPALEVSSGPNRLATLITDAFYRVCATLPSSAGRWLLGHPLIVWTTGAFMTKTDDYRVLAYTHDQHQAYFSGFDSAKTLLQAYESSITDTVTDYAPSFELPVTIMAGAQDELSSVDDVERLAELIGEATKDVETYVLARTGHLLHYERAATTAALIQSRLQA